MTTPLRVLICGDRNWLSPARIYAELAAVRESNTVEVVIDGAAKGADNMGHLAALELGLPTMRFPARWIFYGRAAGPIRNQQMLDEGKPNLVLAFHSNIQESKGTKDMLLRAEKAGVETRLFTEGF